MSQPYSGWAKALLERQNYPDLRMYPGGPPKRPYDVTAHTLPLLMGVEVRDAGRRRAKAQSRAGAVPASRLLSASDSDSWKAVNRVWQDGGTVWRNTASGDFATSAARLAGRRSRARASACTRASSPIWTKAGRAGCSSSSASPTPACTITDIQAGHLRDRFDALVFPDQPAAAIDRGYTARMPEEYQRRPGRKGAAALREFAAAGGTLVFLNRSSEYAIQHLGIKARNVVSGVSESRFLCARISAEREARYRSIR